MKGEPPAVQEEEGKQVILPPSSFVLETIRLDETTTEK